MTTAQEEFEELLRDKGRRAGHPEDDEHSASEHSADEEEDKSLPEDRLEGEEDARPNPGPARHTIPLARYGANTGPKGVIADAQNFRDSMRLHRQSMDSSRLYASRGQQPVVPSALPPLRVTDEDDEDGLDEDDGDFMASWRQQRMRELQSGAHESKGNAQAQSRAGTYGSLTTVDTDGYLDAVEGTPGGRTVIVYIFDDESEVSVVIEHCLRPLAQKHTRTRFVKLHYLDAEMEPAGVPALLAYRGGDKFAGLVPVINEMPDDADISAQTLETVLKRHQILV